MRRRKTFESTKMAYRKKTEHIPGTEAHRRYYLKDRTRVPGGSTIAKLCGADESQRFLIRWANRLGLDGYDSEKYVDKLADVGTLTHARALQFFVGKNIHEFDDLFSKWIIEQSDACYRKFSEWCAGKEFDPIIVEQPFVSEGNRFGGTPDFLGNIKGIEGLPGSPIFLLDWKTSKYCYRSHLYQVAGYAKLLAEHGHPADFGGVLRMGRNPAEGFQFVSRSVKDLEVQWQIFYHGLQMYYLQKQEPQFVN